MNNVRRRRRAVTPLLLPLLATAFAGCEEFRPHDRGAPIPERTLRHIPAVQTGDLPTTRPTTMATTAPTTRGVAFGPELVLNIADVRRMAMTNNLEIQVELYNPTIAREAISEEEARFEALFTTNIDYSRFDTPTASQLDSAQFEGVSVRPGVSLPLRTGGRLTFDTPVDWSRTNNQFATLNPAWSTDARANLTQPLLRGFGRETNEYPIRIARLQYQQSEARTKLELIRVLAAVERVYWRLYAARQELLVRKQEYDLAVNQRDRARRRVGAGAGAEVDVVRAESGVADSLEFVISAENAARDRERELKRVLHQPGLEMESPTVLVTASDPRPVPYNLDGPRLADQAVAQRMEMLEIELQIAQQASTIRFARNQMLPVTSLGYTYRVNGLGPAVDDSISMLTEADYEDHTVGLSIEIPIGNEAARSRLRRAMAQRLQTLASKQQRELQIRHETLAAVDNLNVSWQRLLAARQRVVMGARVLDAEIRQFNLGLRTSTDVLDAQTRLANAKSAEVAAITEYQIAQVDIAFATGTLLGASHVSWTPARTPAP